MMEVKELFQQNMNYATKPRWHGLFWVWWSFFKALMTFCSKDVYSPESEQQRWNVFCMSVIE